MKMWMRGLRSACRTASHARSTSLNAVRDSAGDDRAAHGLGDGLHRLEVALAGDREPGLDDVDPEARELLRDLELLADVERDARRLLAVPQGRVEDLHVVAHGSALSGSRGSRVATAEDPFGQTKNLPGPEARGGVREHRRGARSYVRRRLWVRSSFVMDQPVCQTAPSTMQPACPNVARGGARELPRCSRRSDASSGSVSSPEWPTRSGASCRPRPEAGTRVGDRSRSRSHRQPADRRPRPWVDAGRVGRRAPPTIPVKAKLASGIFHVPGGAQLRPHPPADRCYPRPTAAEADGPAGASKN